MMSRSKRWHSLQAALTQRGVDLVSEEGRTVSAWVWRELEHAPLANWRADLGPATERARTLYRSFMEEFDACYLVPDPPGEKWVRRDLRTRFGFAPDPAVEAVLERIRDRRYHLLVCCRDRYQPRLVGPETFDRTRLRGYFRRVAWIESRHVPLEELRQVATTAPDALDDWLLPLSRGDEGDDFGRRADLVEAFWRQPCFSRAMRLEGLVSLGMGFLTDEPALAERCRNYLLERLPSWEHRWESLTTRLNALLERLGQAETQLVHTWHAEERTALERRVETMRARLEALRLQLQRHLARLLPRPAQVRQLLVGFVNQQIGTVRFSRLSRELEILEARLHRGTRELRQLGFDVSVEALVQDVEGHLRKRPLSSRQRKLPSGERQRRQHDQHTWLQQALELLGRVKALLQQYHPPADRRQQAIAFWLSDVADYYELGVLDRVGVMGGLSRPAWRLERLLRVDSRPSTID